MTTQLMPGVHGLASGFDELRTEVREFIAEQRAAGVFEPQADSWSGGWNPQFSRALGDRGWLGMTLPERYKGHGRTFIERFVVTEELLQAGAPVSAHWVSDRQAGPSLLRYGTDDQKDRYLPRIAAGDIFWAIGMSEPGSGSDLASVQTRATQVEGGWSITGTKLWTSGASSAHVFFVLARSAPLDAQHRHEGLSQFIVPLDAPGITISPIRDMAGNEHFAEVHLDGVFIPDSEVLGKIGSGWEQVTSELGYERSGPERFLSSFLLLSECLRSVADGDVAEDSRLGAALARLYAVHCMSFTVAEALERGEQADVSAAVVKLLGTRLEGDVVDLVDELTDLGSRSLRAEHVRLLRDSLMARPGFTIRGGTVEILRGVVARGLGMR